MSTEEPRSRAFYMFVRFVLFLLLKIFYRFTVTGQDNIPKSGSAILVANHTSFLDPPALGVTSRRQVFFMAKGSLFKVPVLGRIMNGLSAFPVNREKVDLRAFRTAFRLLKRGELVGVFPEGSRQRAGQGRLGPLLDGAALLALKSGAAIIPVGISGTDKVVPSGKHLPRFSRIRAVVGKPIRLEKQGSNKEDTAELTRQIERAIIELLV